MTNIVIICVCVCVCYCIQFVSTSVDCVFSLGLLSSTPVDKQGTPFDSLSSHLLNTLAYGQFRFVLFCLVHLTTYLGVTGWLSC